MQSQNLDFYISRTSEQEPAEISTPRVIADLLKRADVEINGSRPWDIQVYDQAVFSAVLTHGSLGFGEAYMDGYWECEDLSGMITRLLNVRADEMPTGLARIYLALHYLRARLKNLQSKERAFEVGKRHYDIGNDLYEKMLDPNWCYSCGYWAEADNLADAQIAKMDLICRKLKLEPGMKVLEIGCGWGSLAYHMAKNYGVSVYGITVSEEQVKYGRERCKDLPVEIELTDYRDLQGQYDRVVSVGMFEHVGHKNYDEFFDVAMRCLKPEGLFLLHTIGTEKSSGGVDPWIDHYIFPNGELPSLKLVSASIEDRLRMLDMHNFGPYYDTTLMAWWENFKAAWPELKGGKYDERFARMWRYYLMACAAFFRSGRGQLWQFVLTPLDSQIEYHSVR